MNHEAPALALTPLHQSLGATFEPRQGLSEHVPIHYGDLSAEVRALETGAGVFDRSWTDRLTISGADRERFFGGMVSSEVKGLAPGTGTYGFVTSRKGGVLSDFALLALPDAFHLELPSGRAEALEGHLGMYILADRVELARLSETALLGVAGPDGAGVLERASGEAPPEEPWAHREATLAGASVRVVRRPLLGPEPAWTVWVAADEAEAVFRALLEAGGDGVRPVGFDAVEIARVAADVPRWGADFDDSSLPQETGLERWAVSYEKGCYLGQEVVARIHYRGGVKKGLTALEFPAGECPERGTELMFEERAVGTVGSAVRHPERGAIGLAIVHQRGSEPGTRLEVVGGGTAVVGERPGD